MTYPANLSLEVLQQQAAEFSQLRPHLSRIMDLTAGGHQLRDQLHRFLKQRPGEENELYQHRLDKFTYSNILGGSLAQITAKVSSSQLQVQGQPQEFWTRFLNNTNGAGRTQEKLIDNLLLQGLQERIVYLHVDKPQAPFQPRNRAEEEALGLDPKIVLYPATQVPLWGEENGNLTWIKTFQLNEEILGPTSPAMFKATWQIIDAEVIARYASYVKLGHRGQIIELLDEKGEPLDDQETVPLESEVAHGFGQLPVVRLAIPHRLWSADQAAPIAESMLRLECHRYDLLTAAYLQRTYKPIQRPDDDLGETYVDDSMEELPTGLQFVLELDKFEWSEPKGDIIPHIHGSLEKSEQQIRAICGVSAPSVEPTEESGISKKMDFVIEDNRLRSYGHLIRDALEAAYTLVARSVGYSAPTLSGLEEFDQGLTYTPNPEDEDEA